MTIQAVAPSAAQPGPAQAMMRASFLRACRLDVAVRKPGNVSLASAGHGMQAAQFVASAQAAAAPLLQQGSGVGQRIDAAGAASWDAAGCNTNLGILLLCAPLALAAERCGLPCKVGALQAAVRTVLAELDQADAEQAFRAIARANPGGLGRAAEQDVHAAPTVTLRQAMVLAARRDQIAAQYANSFADLFGLALPLLPPGLLPLADDGSAPPATTAWVQRLYLALLSRQPDSHIVRKHGEAVAQIVMRVAQGWFARARAGERVDLHPDFAAWDAALKAQGINPGTTADFTVAALFSAGLLAR